MTVMITIMIMITAGEGDVQYSLTCDPKYDKGLDHYEPKLNLLENL